MNILAIETAVPPGSIALLESTRVMAYQTLGTSQRTTQQFAVVMQGLLQQEECAPRSIGLVAACSGPGSFTGLRIGITAAKVFAYATGAEVLAVNTLELLAYQLDVTGQIVAVLDARRGQVFSATFAKDYEGLQVLEPTAIHDVDPWLAGLRAQQTVTGPGLKPLLGRLPDRVLVADPEFWQPRADVLGKFALSKYQRGERQDLWKLRPKYYRPSAAEEKAAKRG
jgi:tRNA threonylcarbamoyladenosine biosynthesis protein TsaB